MYRLIEKSITGKSSQRDCEDGCFVSDGLVAVIDGGSPKGKLRWAENKTSGWLAKELILKALRTADPSWPNEKIIGHVNAALTAQYGGDLGFFRENPHEQLQAGIVFYNDARKQVVSYGDCPVLINGRLFDHGKFIDVVSTGLRSFYLRLADAGAIRVDPGDRDRFGREAIVDILRKQGFLANRDRPFGFPVINGLELNDKLVIVHDVRPGDEIVLASDGWPRLLPTLRASEKALREQLAADPECYLGFMAAKPRLPGNKSFDDRTYVRIRIER